MLVLVLMFFAWQKEGGKNSVYFDCNGYWFIWPEDQKDLGGFQLREKGKNWLWSIFRTLPPTGKSGLPFDLAAWVYWAGKPTGVIVEPVQVLTIVYRFKQIQ